MQKVLLALTVAALSFGALGTADAKGNGGAEQRAKLKAAIAEARANSADSDTGGGFFSSLFGGGDSQESAKEAASEAGATPSSN
ncbi:MAG: hypothetical protein AAGI70_15390 [Pseudomonadota bacterium]